MSNYRVRRAWLVGDRLALIAFVAVFLGLCTAGPVQAGLILVGLVAVSGALACGVVAIRAGRAR